MSISLPISSFLIWSNLVHTLTLLKYLITSALILFVSQLDLNCIFFAVQHRCIIRPYAISCTRIIVTKMFKCSLFLWRERLCLLCVVRRVVQCFCLLCCFRLWYAGCGVTLR
jgi:hypothetical protein